MQKLLKHYIRVAHMQYFDYIRDKIEGLRAELHYEGADITMQFKIAMLEYGILPEEGLINCIPGAIVPSSTSSLKLNVPMPKVNYSPIFNRDIKQFYKVFLQNQLCRNI